MWWNFKGLSIILKKYRERIFEQPSYFLYVNTVLFNQYKLEKNKTEKVKQYMNENSLKCYPIGFGANERL